MNQSEPSALSRLESIGKKGKLSKMIKLTIEHFDILKNSLNECSLKILAYIIKGFLLAIKKNSEHFIKDLEIFIDINIKGISKKQIKIRQKVVQDEKIFTIQNLSLFSENTQFEKFLKDTNMTEKINNTLKRINKKFTSVDFSTMTEEMKKDYLKRHFIQPLTDSLPLSFDYFGNSNLEKCISNSINDNLANYINFDLKTINHDFLEKKKFSQSQSQTEAPGRPDLLQEMTDEIQMLENNLPIVISKNKTYNLKYDDKLEFNVEKYCAKNENVIDKENGVDDSYYVFQKNYKKVLIADQLSKFKNNLETNIKEITILEKFSKDLIIDNFSEFNFILENDFGDVCRRNSYNTPVSNKFSQNSINELMQTTSIKNIFPHSADIKIIENVSADVAILAAQVDESPKIIELSSEINLASYSEFLNKKVNELEEENLLMYSEELQDLIKK